MKEIKDYLHLYLGGKCFLTEEQGDTPRLFDIDGFLVNHIREGIYHDAQPILRPLSDMSEGELQECGNMVYDFSGEPELNNHKWQDFEICATEQFFWLIKRHFDLFGLIESGLAIDKTKINEKSIPHSK